LSLRNANVADIGIGTGQLSRVFRAHGVKSIIGIDSCEKYLAACRNKRAVDQTIRQDIGSGIALPSDSVDLCASSGVLPYFASTSSLIGEMVRVTKQFGFVAINYHPGIRERQFEMISASSLGATKEVPVYHHLPEAIEKQFADAGAKWIYTRTNEQGILRDRPTGRRWIPLETAIFQKTAPAPAIN
jgi:ubiquinone/menaquinone biosynthesis C-methylase UbiE